MKVLIVEDTGATGELLAAAVRRVDGLEAHVVSGGFEALKTLPRHPFHLIIADLQLPDINALELLNFVKKNPRYRHTPVLLVAAHELGAERDRGLELGAAAVLSKPVVADEVEALVRRLLLTQGEDG